MKTKIIFILNFFALILFQSCEILEVEAYDSIAGEEVLTSKKGLDGSLIGAYNSLQSGSIATDAIVFADLAADNLIARGSKLEYREVSENSIQASNAYVTSLWNASYRGINLVNYIIEGISSVKGISEAEKNNYLAQCHFLRAFHYFNLVRYFGNIPKRVKPISDASPETLSIPVSPQSEIYSLIISDLQIAEQYLVGRGNSVYANQGAAKALLAKVYLYQKDWAKAVQKADEVIAMGYTLEMSNYASIFNESFNNQEIIFQIDFANSQDATNLMNDWLTPVGRFEVAVWKNLSRTQTLATDFESGDLRKNSTVKYYVGSKGDDWYCAKYTDNVKNKDNIIILRLAEMYLIKAEASNEINYIANGEAFIALNKIRNRAGLANLSSTTITNQAEFRLAIEKERNLELAFEGNRLFDLRRTDRINQVLPDIGTLKEAGWYFPIPQSEIDTNDGI